MRRLYHPLHPDPVHGIRHCQCIIHLSRSLLYSLPWRTVVFVFVGWPRTTLVSTWMGDHQGRLSALNLRPFVGVDLNQICDRLTIWPSSCWHRRKMNQTKPSAATLVSRRILSVWLVSLVKTAWWSQLVNLSTHLLFNPLLCKLSAWDCLVISSIRKQHSDLVSTMISMQRGLQRFLRNIWCRLVTCLALLLHVVFSTTSPSELPSSYGWVSICVCPTNVLVLLPWTRKEGINGLASIPRSYQKNGIPVTVTVIHLLADSCLSSLTHSLRVAHQLNWLQTGSMKNMSAFLPAAYSGQSSSKFWTHSIPRWSTCYPSLATNSDNHQTGQRLSVCLQRFNAVAFNDTFPD